MIDVIQTAEFVADTKAQSLQVRDSGELVIEGFASDYGEDRQGEIFAPDAFDASIKSFMENPVLLYHHDPSKALGRVLELSRRDGGMWMKAVIDKPSAGSWAEDIYEKVKRGTIRGLSVGGKFYRKLVNGKPLIHRTDLMEISVTPLPVNQRTLFAVAGKAFSSEPDLAEESRIMDQLDSLERIFDRLCHNEG